MPSFFCGIFGHKPSAGEVVPNSGQLPVGVGKAEVYSKLLLILL